MYNTVYICIDAYDILGQTWYPVEVLVMPSSYIHVHVRVCISRI